MRRSDAAGPVGLTRNGHRTYRLCTVRPRSGHVESTPIRGGTHMFSGSRRHDDAAHGSAPSRNGLSSSHRRVALASAVAVVALLATSLPGMAKPPPPEKIFALEIYPNVGDNSWITGTTMDMTARLINRSPGGNSNFSSFDVFVPSAFTVNTGATDKTDVSGNNGANLSTTVSINPSGVTCPQASGCTVVRVGGIDTVKQ